MHFILPAFYMQNYNKKLHLHRLKTLHRTRMRSQTCASSLFNPSNYIPLLDECISQRAVENRQIVANAEQIFRRGSWQFRVPRILRHCCSASVRIALAGKSEVRGKLFALSLHHDSRPHLACFKIITHLFINIEVDIITPRRIHYSSIFYANN